MEETEKVSDLPEVTQQVGGRTRILPLSPALMLFPPYQVDFWEMPASTYQPTVKSPWQLKILRACEFSLTSFHGSSCPV